MTLTLKLPVPPSINAAYANQRKGWGGRGRYKTQKYKAWLSLADSYLYYYSRSTKGPSGPLSLHITLPSTMRGDITNRIKVVEDYLVSRKITADDRHNHEVSVRKSSAIDYCEVTIKSLTSSPI